MTLDVAVVDNKGNFIPGIPPGNFRVLEDNVPQQIRKVDMGEAPMTIALSMPNSRRTLAIAVSSRRIRAMPVEFSCIASACWICRDQ